MGALLPNVLFNRLAKGVALLWSDQWEAGEALSTPYKELCDRAARKIRRVLAYQGQLVRLCMSVETTMVGYQR